MMEMMESLATVVLGLVAALVPAPFVEEWIAAVLLVFIAVPLGLIIEAHIWQCLPTDVALRYDGMPKFVLMGLVIFLTGWITFVVGRFSGTCCSPESSSLGRTATSAPARRS
jgi:phosphate transport system permease protein